MVTGKAERLSTLEVVRYFHSRPRDSQIGAWVSKQLRISARGILESKFPSSSRSFNRANAVTQLLGGCEYRTDGAWQGGEHRLHDRFMSSTRRRRTEKSTVLRPKDAKILFS